MSPWLAGAAQIAVLLILLALLHRPLGDYLARVLTSDRDLKVERGLYRLLRIDARADQRWSTYLLAVMGFSVVSIGVLWLILSIQRILPFAQGHGPMTVDQGLNTAVSFVTNTNWQSYSGEQTLGLFSQTAGLTVQNFLSAAVGIAVMAAMIRGFVRRHTDRLGNFWVDITRIVVRVLLPISLLGATVLIAGGVIQNLSDPMTVTTLSGGSQTLPGGLVASQEAIKELGTNGGGFFNANSAHPFENPNAFTNLFEVFLLLLIPSALPRTFGRMVGSLKQGYAVLAVMAVLWGLSLTATLISENAHAGIAMRAAGLGSLDPRKMIRNPVMFVVLVGALLCTVLSFTERSLFAVLATVWLWLTVLFANLADAVAEGRARARAASLRAGRDTLTARRINVAGVESAVPAAELTIGDLVVCEAGDVIPGDGDIVQGVASVDESAITGESAPVVRESGGDRSSVTGGTRVLSDRIVVKITTEPGQSFVDRMIALVEGSQRQKTPNEIALNILLASLTIVFLLVVMALQPMAGYSGSPQSVIVLVSLLVCLIPTTIGALVSCIGVAGMDRLVQRNVLAMSGKAVEAAGDVSTLLLDKTGTITYGNRQATALYPAPGVEAEELSGAALLASLADETPEGKSIVELCVRQGAKLDVATAQSRAGEVVDFSARTRMSGVDVPRPGDRPLQIRKGAVSAVAAWLDQRGVKVPAEPLAAADEVSSDGGTPLLVATTSRALGVVHLKDVVKPDIAERFADLRAMGIRTVMITGDSELTARSIAAEAGVDDCLAEATPEDKMAYIKREQLGGRIVAMTGDGTNDAPALAQADVGVAMNTGTAAAKEAGNMVDLDSSPTKLIDIVEIGKQLLITRGALTTFSLANDVAKYFAILPAMFVGVFPGLSALNIMKLSSPQSAILSAVVFNALVIVALIPLAMRGVSYRATSAASMLARNLTIYGLGGLVAPFVGIKLIDLLVSLIPGIG